MHKFKNMYLYILLLGVGTLVVMASGFGPEGPGLTPDAAKDPPSACGVRARKIYGSESPLVSR